jgi:sensor histidine kinase regulating citrate/malate metabolism
MNFFRSIAAKILVPVLIMTTLLIAISVTVGMFTLSSITDQLLDNEIQVFSQSIEHNIEAQQTLALSQVSGVTESVPLRQAIKDKDLARIRETILGYKETRDCDFFTVIDTDGNVIFRSDNPDRPGGDSMANLRGVRAVIDRRATDVSYVSTAAIPMSIRATAPIFDEDGTTFIGILAGGIKMDTDEWVDAMKETYSVECTVFAGRMRVATTIMESIASTKRAIGTELTNDAVYDAVFNKTEI